MVLLWVRNGMTWVRSGMAIYGLGYEMVWDESAWVRNDLIPPQVHPIEINCNIYVCDLSFSYSHGRQSILSQRCWDGDRPMQNTREH